MGFINALERRDDITLQLVLASNWNIEQAPALSKLILQLLPSAREVEEIIGADRFTLRFYYQNQDFMLHFEDYSQSCWIEVATGSASELDTLTEQLATIQRCQFNDG